MMKEKLNGLSRPPLPPAYDFLYDEITPDGVQARFYCAKGGRGKGATWSIARRLIDKAHTQPSRVLCTRSVQNSIADSVHRVLADQIQLLGYGDFFEIQAHRIFSKVSSSEFLFRGLNDLTVQSVKSIEGITDVWVAEAEDMGPRSWRVLRPTIRAKGSKFWVDYNPETEKSPTNQLFTVNVPRSAIVRHINYDQNPYFPPELEEERQDALLMISRATNDDAREIAQQEYNHVWLGHCRKSGKASIFGAKHHIQEFTPNVDAGKWDGPYDGADWGFGSDPTVRVRVWIWTHLNDTKWLCIEREVMLKGADGMALDLRDVPKGFDGFPDSRKVKIRGDNSQPQTIGYMKNAGFNIVAADKWSGSVEDGIQHMRGAYQGIIVHPRCVETAKEMQLYSYKVDKLTGDVLNDIVSGFDHCIDAIRYAIEPMIQRKRGAHAFG